MTELPETLDLGLVAFRVDDEGEHPGGGHCVSLSQTESEGTVELVDQYLTALGHLVESAAESPDGGWALTRPLLFHARHTAELAAKAALLAGGVAYERHHGLVTLWGKLADAGLDQKVPAVDAGWCHNFTSVVADLAGNSIGARYAKPNAGHTPIDEIWCCVNPAALFAVTESFAVQCVAIAQAAADAIADQA